MKIGSLKINHPLCLAPMQDVTDQAFRLICKKSGADIVYTEFTSSEAIIRNVPRAIRKIKITDAERPIGIQIVGNNIPALTEAVRISDKFKPDIIDINCGCWTKRHALRGEGAGLLKDIPLLERIIKALVKATKTPITVKTRLGWDKNDIVILDLAQMVEQSGAKALTVHCRTRTQKYKGKADWSWLTKIKKKISIPLIGNGDVVSVEDVQAMFSTGCDGVMIGRAAVSNPWIFQQAKHFMKTAENMPPPALPEKIKLCIEHLKLSVKYRGETEGVIVFRKFYSGYLRGFSGVAKLRGELMLFKQTAPIIKKLEELI